MKSVIAHGLCHLFSLILLHMPFPCLLWSTHGRMQGKFFCILCDLYLSLHSPNTTCHSAQVLVGTAVLNWAGREKSTHATDKRHVNCYHHMIVSWPPRFQPGTDHGKFPNHWVDNRGEMGAFSHILPKHGMVVIFSFLIESLKLQNC